MSCVVEIQLKTKICFLVYLKFLEATSTWFVVNLLDDSMIVYAMVHKL